MPVASAWLPNTHHGECQYSSLAITDAPAKAHEAWREGNELLSLRSGRISFTEALSICVRPIVATAPVPICIDLWAMRLPSDMLSAGL